MINGGTLIEWGFQTGRHFKAMVEEAKRLEQSGASKDAIFTALEAMVPVEISMRTNSIPYSVFLEPETEQERENLRNVGLHMDALMRVPTIKAGAVMPDACPSGSQMGTIPVGGAVAAEDAIHPGFHSADICCSVAISVFKRDMDPSRVLDAVQASTHFGGGGRDKILPMPKELQDQADKGFANPFLKGLENFAIGHFGSQGDGNHFAYVGRLKSTGQIALVTHHGSRGLGAQLYKRGMVVAKKHTAIRAPKVPDHNAWIKASSDDGRAYWDALQFIRAWTRASHYAIHDLTAGAIGNSVVDRFWNEHNFVFRRSDGLYYHGKGATPSWDGFGDDDSGLTLIPLNMAEPILVTRHRNRRESLGFAPHGAGRNTSRTAHLRAFDGQLDSELATLASKGLDIRSYCGVPDLSELPSAYKNAASVRSQIEKFDLAEVVDEVVPCGSIMAGDWQVDAPWRKAKKPKG